MIEEANVGTDPGRNRDLTRPEVETLLDRWFLPSTREAVSQDQSGA
jgi:hypothetical protein